jgi:cytoskeleton protein RodZ
MKSVGNQLESARLGRNWTPEAAAKITKIRVEQLLDLERDDFSRFPSPAYARGFVRLYAKSLGLDDRRLLAQLDGRLEEEDETGFVPAPSVEYIPQRTEITAPIRINRFGLSVILIVAALFAVVFLVTMLLANKANVKMSDITAPPTTASGKIVNGTSTASRPLPANDDKTPVAKAATPAALKAAKDDDVPQAKAATPADLAKADAEAKAAAAAAPVTVQPPAPAKHTLMLHATRESWVRIWSIDKDGDKVLFEGILEPGKSAGQAAEAGQLKPFEATQFKVTVAVPAAIEIIFDGYNSGPYSENEKPPETFNVP